MSLGKKRLPRLGILVVALLSCIDSDWTVGSLLLAMAFVSWVVLEGNWVEKVKVRIRNERLKRKRSMLQSLEIFSEWRGAEISFTHEKNASMAPSFLNHSNLFAGSRCFWLSGSLSDQPPDSSSSYSMSSGGRNIVFPARSADPTAGKILLVEDIEVNRMLLRKLFRDLNVLFEEAENGQIAVDYFKQGKNYDLVLMDKEMPVMDGHEATRQLRLLGVKTPIIALSGNSLPSDKDMFFQAGADEFKTKPLSRDELVNLLARYGLERPQ
ncbi:two-component system protein A-like [Aristolochia californica]|uniref:two-component system protein A-like n=1 Tax=Aristolochia californica TaxID=171875 RepID=UPI0035DBCC54